MVTDPIADVLTRIRNAQRVGQKLTRVRYSKTGSNVLNVLKGEGFIAGFEQKKDRDGKFDEYEVELKYYSDGEPGIRLAKRVSKPGKRVYVKVGEIPQVYGGLGAVIMSTSQGVMAGRQARKLNIGGEILAKIG